MMCSEFQLGILPGASLHGRACEGKLRATTTSLDCYVVLLSCYCRAACVVKNSETDLKLTSRSAALRLQRCKQNSSESITNYYRDILCLALASSSLRRDVPIYISGSASTLLTCKQCHKIGKKGNRLRPTSAQGPGDGHAWPIASLQRLLCQRTPP